MTLWILVAILSYLFFALSSFGDKLVLSGPPKAGTYTFYVGVVGLSVLIFLPFAKFQILGLETALWIFFASLVHIIGLYLMFYAIEKFEVTKIVTVIGATQPIFIFGLMWIFFESQQLSIKNFIAFILFVLGSVIISVGFDGKKINGYINLVLVSSLMFSLDYIFQKKIFLEQDFLPGLIWIRVVMFFMVLFLLFNKKIRQGIFFRKKEKISPKSGVVFILAQLSGAIANLLQGWSIFLAPVMFLPIVNSLRGIQYVFLFILILLSTIFIPTVLKEKLSLRIFLQKMLATIIIGVGFWFLTV